MDWTNGRSTITPNANLTNWQLSKFGMKIPVPPKQDRFDLCYTISIDPNCLFRGANITGQVHMTYYRCIDGFSTDSATPIWTTKDSWGLDEGKINYDCRFLEGPIVDGSACDYIVITLEISSVQEVSCLQFNYGLTEYLLP